MSQTTSPSTGKPYGLARVCKVWNYARSTYYWQKGKEAKPKRRPGPQGDYSDSQLVEHIKIILSSSPFHGEGYRKVWAKLRFQGIRTSKRRVLRLMRDNALLAPHRKGSPKGPKAHNGKITTPFINQMWGTDKTESFTINEGRASIFIAVDHCSCECVGIHAAKYGTRFEALEPIRQAIRERFGSFCKDIAYGLKVRHDHGSQYMSDDFQQELKFLGIESSPAFVREPEGNGCAERFIRVLKENLLWVKSFETVEELRQALLEFKETYNNSWIIERHGYKTPAQVREEQLRSLSKAV